MAASNFSTGYRIVLAAIIFVMLPFGLGAHAQDCCPGGDSAPEVTITSPLSEEPFETELPTITLSGEVEEDCALKSVTWRVGDDPADAEGIASGDTSDWLAWLWEAANIPLVEGSQTITVTAEDAAGNIGEATLEVVYTPPGQPPDPPPGSAKELDHKKDKFTFYFGSEYYDDLDRVSVVAYLQKEADEVFVMPFDEDVTVMVEISEPGDPDSLRQVFMQTIPAGTVSGTTKYRYVLSGVGIRELVFQKSTSTKIYFYLYVQKWNFLPDLKAAMSPAEYQDYVRSIPSCTLSIWKGEDKLWRGEAPLTPGSYSTYKQEMVYNR